MEEFLIKVLKDWKKIFKNVTAVFNLENWRKVLEYVYISEARMLNGKSVEELWIKKNNF